MVESIEEEFTKNYRQQPSFDSNDVISSKVLTRDLDRCDAFKVE